MSKKFLCLLMALMLSVGMATISLAEDNDLLTRIRQRGELIVATEGAWAPWTYHDESNQLVGFDVEVARLIADKLGVKATFVECEWDSIFAGIDAGRYDMAANGVEITDERAEKYDFSTPYGYIRTALIVRGDNTDISGFADLNGKRTANSIASTYMTLAESYGAEAVGVDTLDQTIDMVLAGRADATLNAEVSFYDYMRVHPDANLKVVALTEEASRVSIPLRKGPETATLLDAVNQAITELSESGELSRLSQQYFGSDIAQPGADTVQTEEEAPMLSLTIGDRSYTAALEHNATADALLDRLPLNLTMTELNGNEKYVYLDSALPSDSRRVGRVQAGDLMLFGKDCLVLFYGDADTNYSYTPIGHLNDTAGLREALKSDSAAVGFRLS